MASGITRVGSAKPTGKPVRIWVPELGGSLVNPALDSTVPGRTLRLKKGEGRGPGLVHGPGGTGGRGVGRKMAFPSVLGVLLMSREGL